MTTSPTIEPVAVDPDKDTIEAVARAGFQSYYSKRPWTWETAQFVTAERWRIVATQVLYGQIETPRALRAAYTQDMVRSPWRGLSSPHGQTWSRVHGVMLRAVESRQVAA